MELNDTEPVDQAKINTYFRQREKSHIDLWKLQEEWEKKQKV
jgi:hypothetical protein